MTIIVIAMTKVMMMITTIIGAMADEKVEIDKETTKEGLLLVGVQHQTIEVNLPVIQISTLAQED